MAVFAVFPILLLAFHLPAAEPKPIVAELKPHPDNPPGGHYGMSFQKIQLRTTASDAHAE